MQSARLRASIATAAVLVVLAACSVDTAGTPTAPPLPGGNASARQVLQANRWLDPGGGVLLAEGAPSDAVDRAFCDYLTGTVAQVATVAKLARPVVLNRNSGYEFHGDTRVFCAYDAGGDEAAFVMAFGAPANLTDLRTGTGFLSVAAPQGWRAALAYRPSYSGARMSVATATAWLRAGAARIAD